MNMDAIGLNQDILTSLANSQLENLSINGDDIPADGVGSVDFGRILLSRLDRDGNGTICEQELQQGLDDALSLLRTLDHPSSRLHPGLQPASADAPQESGISLRDRFSIPGMMASVGELMELTGHGQGSGNIVPYNMLMDQLLAR